MSQQKHWTYEQAQALMDTPFMALLAQAHAIHAANFDVSKIQVSSLMSIKTGACSEDCKYCSQSAHHHSGLKPERLIDAQSVIEKAKEAKAQGATRFCMGAAWKNPKERDIPELKKIVTGVKALGLETCMTLGKLSQKHAELLFDAGLDYYNHNLDTSAEFYPQIVTTHSYQDRLETLEHVRNAGIKVCTGGIIGLGESKKDRLSLLVQLANLDPQPESVPINKLIRIKGTPLESSEDVDIFDFIRVVAMARIMLPTSFVRLSAGRESMSDEAQALCFFAGANSLFAGSKLLTTPNKEHAADEALFKRLDLLPL